MKSIHRMISIHESNKQWLFWNSPLYFHSIPSQVALTLLGWRRPHSHVMLAPPPGHTGAPPLTHQGDISTLRHPHPLLGLHHLRTLRWDGHCSAPCSHYCGGAGPSTHQPLPSITMYSNKNKVISLVIVEYSQLKWSSSMNRQFFNLTFSYMFSLIIYVMVL